MVDEGTLHIANYLFVHVSVEPNMHDLDSFVRLVSLPDVAVYIKQPESVLIERTRTRGHKRIPGDANVLVDRFIKHSLAVFEKLAAHSRLETRLLLVDRGECTEMTRESSANPLREYARRIITNGIIPTGTENLQTDHA
jgi:thymidylate kinase